MEVEKMTELEFHLHAFKYFIIGMQDELKANQNQYLRGDVPKIEDYYLPELKRLVDKLA